MKKKTLFVVVALTVMALVPAITAGAPKEANPKKQITLRYANFPPAPTFPCVQMERWAKEVEKRTNGQVKVNTFPGSTLLDAKSMFDGVLSGIADIGCSCPGYEPNRFPLLQI